MGNCFLRMNKGGEKVMEDNWRLSFTQLKQPTNNGSPENSDDNGLTTIRQVLKEKRTNYIYCICFYSSRKPIINKEICRFDDTVETV